MVPLRYLSRVTLNRFSTLDVGHWTGSILRITHYSRQEGKLLAVRFQLTQFSHLTNQLFNLPFSAPDCPFTYHCSSTSGCRIESGMTVRVVIPAEAGIQRNGASTLPITRYS